MGAIGEDCTSIDSSRCISCFRCVKRCPVKAKGCFTPEYESFAQAFSQRLKEPRENQYFCPGKGTRYIKERQALGCLPFVLFLGGSQRT